MTDRSIDTVAPAGPYASAARDYWAKGWVNPLPVRGKKVDLPKGYTGYDGANVSWPDLTAWIEDRAADNICLRMVTTVGIDVDDYAEKIGRASFVRAIEKLGKLPRTWSSTSRGQGQPARIYLYRVPVGTDFGSEPGRPSAQGRFKKAFGPDVDIIHRTHRYAVVAPSVHPETGQVYAWYGPDGEPCDIPDRADLPELPQAWIDFLSGATEIEQPGTTPAAVTGTPWERPVALREITKQVERVAAAKGNINDTLGGAARFIGRFIPAVIDQASAEAQLLDALDAGGVHSDGWNIANGKTWTGLSCIRDGLAAGMAEPRDVVDVVETTPRELAAAVGTGRGTPPLEVSSTADMTYWLQDEIGQGRLSGFFRRSGAIVHSPRIGEAGYVPLTGDGQDDDGPAQVRAVTKESLAAKIQYMHDCYRVSTDEETGERRIRSALFPVPAAAFAIASPEDMPHLRRLAGVVHTPIVRRDGSILAEPGYDPVTALLHLPEPGLIVPEVPAEPTEQDGKEARELIDKMLAGFPWQGESDLANAYGYLLTPMMRDLTPPPYKMFAINAHQPASGKTLLANVGRWIHGGVFRSEMPPDDAELKKATTGILHTTTAPVVIVDNVSGVLKSSALAGLLTSREWSDRVLGKTLDLRLVNDRVWTITGNNLALGGDLPRRTVVIAIDPGMPNPETRTGFGIADLEAWIGEHRGRLLWSLLVLIRRWVVAGRPAPVRKQSDGYTAWETAVGGILELAGVPGTFDAAEARADTAGGEDEPWGEFLEALWPLFGDRPLYEKDVIAKLGFVEGDVLRPLSPERLPSKELEQDARQGRLSARSLGFWFTNREGRWAGDLTVRGGKKTKHGRPWSLERYEHR